MCYEMMRVTARSYFSFSGCYRPCINYICINMEKVSSDSWAKYVVMTREGATSMKINAFYKITIPKPLD